MQFDSLGFVRFGSVVSLSGMIKETKPVVIDGKTTYYVPSNLEFIRKVGSGAYGTVASFKDPATGMLISSLFMPRFRRQVCSQESAECIRRLD